MDDRAILDLGHAMWVLDPKRMNFETSFGTLAWEGPTSGRCHVVEDGGRLLGWARLTPPYSRIRRMGERDVAPAALAWMVDWRSPDATGVLEELVGWAGGLVDGAFTTSHADADRAAARALAALGFVPEPNEPFGIYLRQPLASLLPPPPIPQGYVLTTMADLDDDVDLRAAAHRVAWEGSTRSGDDVRRTMAQWPYRADLDVVLLTDGGEPVGSALVWFDESYEYGELEPIGVAPEHRGRGLAATMLRHALAGLRDARAAHAVVGARGDDDYPVPRRVYASVGFETITTQRIVLARG